MSKYFLNIVFIVCALTSISRADIVRDDPNAVVTASQHDTLIVTQDKVWIFNRAQLVDMAAESLKQDSLLVLYKQNKMLSDSLFLLQDELTMRLNNVIGLQEQGYDSLRTLFDRTEHLVNLSTANTDRALSHIKHLKWMSYASGTFLGGISGGLVGGQIVSDNKFEFNWVGAVVGAGLGFALNRFLLNLR